MNKVVNGDCLELFKQIEDNSIDSVVTDSPYGLGFMNKKWDTMTSKGLYDFVLQWSSECFRVLKPGGYILSFGGTRTYHRMACAIEDAGFELRDMIMWIYGSGFPKSLNVGKAVDKLQGNEREIVTKGKPMGSLGVMHDDKWESDAEYNITKGNSEWEGYGTALKPACEPICVARKPISEKTITDNVLKHGTGAINIDGCRIALSDSENIPSGSGHLMFKANEFNPVKRNKRESETWEKGSGFKNENNGIATPSDKGRFPANIIFDEEAADFLDEQAPNTGAMAKVKSGSSDKTKGIYGKYQNNGDDGDTFYNDKGGASRFFYCAKVSKSERNKGLNGFEEKAIEIQQPHNSKDLEERYNMKSLNHHPTIKPISLMRYLVRLVTREGQTCLDPFGGSGSTGIACKMEGVNYILFEKDPEYCKIAESRIESHEREEKLNLFEK